MPEVGLDQSSLQTSFAEVLAARAEQPLRAMSAPGAVLLLTGDAGSGKSYLAEHVARKVENEGRGAVRAFVLPQPPAAMNDPQAVFADLFPEAFVDGGADPIDQLAETFQARRLAERIVALARSAAGSAEPLLVLPGIDRYSLRSAAVLEHLIRQGGARIIGTARRMTGGAGHMGRDPRVTRLTVAPLDLQEADALITSLLGNAHLAPATLKRWHAVTEGNSHALMLMLIANERSGSLQRVHGVAYVPSGRDEIPEELSWHLSETCSEREYEALEMLALAEPMSEPPLLRLLDPHVTNALIDRGLVSTHPSDGRPSVLRFSRPILAAALRARMTPSRRIELAETFFHALTGETPPEEFARSSLLLRAVAFGLECGKPLSHDWLTGAIDQLRTGTDARLMLSVSLALARGYSTEDAAAASLRALSYATQLGDLAAVEAAQVRIGEFVADAPAFAALPSMLRNRLRLSQIEQLFGQGAPMGQALEELRAFEEDLEPGESVSREAVRALRYRLMLREGDFASAAAHPIDVEPSSEIVVEWVRSPAISLSAVMLLQQGDMEEAIRLAHRARSISLIGRRPLNDTLELQGFFWFLGYWANGCAGSARQALEEVEADAEANRQTGARFSELVETGWALLALQEARWRDAAELIELIVASRVPIDGYGIAPLLGAMRALALAALGDRAGAVAELRGARAHRRGVSQALAGFRMRIALQAQQWLRLGDLGADALGLATWAEGQSLRLIELQALHMVATESRVRAHSISGRARELAEQVDPLIGEVILSHIEKIAAGASPSDVSEPELRLLAELGIWMPLPGASGLSPREREIALFASLGYPSRFIAERFHLSARTVETHLAHVYAKLGIADRAELRQWFSADRRLGDETRSFGTLGIRALDESRIRTSPRAASGLLRQSRSRT